MKSKPKEVVYKRMTGKFFIGYTVPDCYLIEHFLSCFTSQWHRGIFYEHDIPKLQRIAELHNCILRQEKK